MNVDAIAEVIRVFKPMGFFVGAKPAALAKKLAVAPDAWSGPLQSWAPDADEPRCFSDLAVLAHDRSRVWRLESWEILLDKVAKEEGYAFCASWDEVLQQLVKLAAPRLKLRGTVSGRSAEVSVAGKKHRFGFRTEGKSFSTDFLLKLNRVLAGSGHEFAFVSSRFCTGYVLLLTPAERERLRAERGWEFEPLSPA